MIEAGANEISNEVMLEAIKKGHEEIKKVCDFIQMIKNEIGKPKFEYKSFEVDHEVYEEIEKCRVIHWICNRELLQILEFIFPK